jgi:hypothetical protein
MKSLKITTVTLLFSISSFVHAEKLDNILKSASQENSQVLENSTAVIHDAQKLLESGKQLKVGELTNLLVQRLDITQQQAMGGAGALLQIAKMRMNPEAFAKLSTQIPDVEQLLLAVPALKPQSVSGGLAGKLGNLAGNSSIGTVLTAVSIFQQLGMKPEIMEKFVPVVIDYARGNTDEAIVGGLKAALSTDKKQR